VAAAALGPCAGLGAARVVLSHFSVIVKGSAQMFVAGPPVVAWAMNETPDKEELGGARTQLRAGAVDAEAVDEADALAQIKRFLSYLPDSVWEPPPIHASTDPSDRREEELLGIIPRDERKVYRMRRLLELVLDEGSIFELGRQFGGSIITALARLAGRPVGVLASDPRHYGGGLSAAAAEKETRFVDMCDQFRIPIVNFVDQPGFVVGTESERAGTMRRGARLIAAVQQASIPWCSIIVRKCFGIAGAAHGDGTRLNLRYAWPSGSWGSLPIAGGLEAAYRRDLEAAEDPVALRAAIEARLRAAGSPFRTAEHFSIEALIDPRDTRPLLCDWAIRAHELVAQDVRSEEPIRRRGLRP
jgi:acetyl-CoA carboxylase carboxyltransferase component